MSIQSEITRISGNVADAFTAIRSFGVTVPASTKSDSLDTYIAQIAPRIAKSTASINTSGTTITFSNIPSKPRALFVYIKNTVSFQASNYYYIYSVVYNQSLGSNDKCHADYGYSSAVYFAESTKSSTKVSWTWKSNTNSLILTSEATSATTAPGYFRSGITYEVVCIY